MHETLVVYMIKSFSHIDENIPQELGQNVVMTPNALLEVCSLYVVHEHEWAFVDLAVFNIVDDIWMVVDLLEDLATVKEGPLIRILLENSALRRANHPA